MPENNIIHSTQPYRDFDDDLGGLGTVLFGYMKEYSNKVALIQSETDESETFGSLLRRCIKTALHLRKIGIKKGDVVCVCAEMTIVSYVAVIASYFVAEAAVHVNNVPPSLFLATESAEGFVNTVLRQTNVTSRVIVLNKGFESLCESQSGDGNIEHFIPEYIEDSGDRVCIFFTSGSTGTPKPVQLSHYCCYCAIPDISGAWSRNGLYLKGFKDSVILDCSNWHWITALHTLMMCTSNGATQVLAKHLDGEKIWEIVKKYKVTNLSLAPYTCIEFYNATPENPKSYLASLREILYGGSRLAEKYVVLFNNLLQPEAYIRGEYGSSETGFLTNFNPSDEEHRRYIQRCPRSSGCPVPGYTYKVVDTESGKKLGPNQIGELRVKPLNRKSLFNGYVGLDVQNLFDDDGYYKTQDLAYYDENFCFYVVDRLKARITYKNWLIYPLTVEAVLLQHPRVSNAVVIGTTRTSRKY